MTTPMTANQYRSYTLLGRDGETENLELQFLGEGSSYRDGKDRWFDIALYRTREGEYVVHTVGRSNVAGERDLGRIAKTMSRFEVVELLTVTHHGETYVPRASVLALSQAAAIDDGIREVYLRVVA